MIENSFIFLEKIKKKREENIWKQGITCWDDFLSKGPDEIKGISKKSKLYYDQKIREAKKELYNYNPEYFINKLPLSEIWRLYNLFKDEAVFLDIETTGIGKVQDIIVVGLFDGISTKLLIKGINLDYNILKKELKRYKLLITYNGVSYDIPYLRRWYFKVFQDIPHIPHIDLKNLCHKLGYSGGLKKIEKRLGIIRNPLMDKFQGGDILRLWKMWRASGDEYYLNLLVEYNEEDIINLKKIANYSIDIMKKELKKKITELKK
jgi:uncharacterized protein YprB with RNaseH-like and TPR domain